MPHTLEQKRNRMKERYKANPEFFKNKSKENYRKDPAKWMESTDRWRKQNTVKVRASLNRYKVNNPEKVLAHKLLLKAVKEGVVNRPSSCSKCDKECKPQGHHNDYTKPLEVIWMCVKCHVNFHLEEKKGE